MSSPPEFVMLHNRQCNRRATVPRFTTQSFGFLKNDSCCKATSVGGLDRPKVHYIRAVWPLFASGTRCAHECACVCLFVFACVQPHWSPNTPSTLHSCWPCDSSSKGYRWLHLVQAYRADVAILPQRRYQQPTPSTWKLSGLPVSLSRIKISFTHYVGIQR